MTQGQAHQLLHGYRNGHGQLEASLRLGERDSELVTRLSDLSGNLTAGIKFDSYLTVYRLPGREYFALARTWPDPEAPRAGCVLTHTLLIPLEHWAALTNVKSLDRLFTNPRAKPTFDFSSPLEFSSAVPIPLNQSIEVDLPTAEVFVARYFGKGLRPIVWFNACEPEECLWRLLEHLWPKLRCAFSCCTFSLQQRPLDDGPFDLLFAPSTIYSRFTKLTADHLIEVGTQAPSSGENTPWYRYWAKAFFSPYSSLPSNESELAIWNELDEDPTSIRKLSLVHELRLRSTQSPTAGVGAIDVAESLARDPESAIALKRQVFADAIQAAINAEPVADALSTLRLIDDRLHREAFRDVARDFEQPLSVAAAKVTVKSPEAALRISEAWLNDSLRGDKSGFVGGVVVGLREVAQNNPSRLNMLSSFPDVAAELFRLTPAFGATYLEVGGETARQVMADWLSSTQDLDAIRIVRNSVLAAKHRIDDQELLSTLLRGIGPSEVKETLNLLSQFDGGFSNKAVCRAVTDRVSSAYPDLVRQWAAASSDWTPGVPNIVASTFAQSRSGFNELLEARQFDRVQQTRVLTAMLEMQFTSGFPYWLRELISENGTILNLLLLHSDEIDSIESILGRIVAEISDLPLAESSELLNSVLKFSDRHFFPQLRDSAMRSLISRYIKDGADTEESREFLKNPKILPWFTSVSSSKLSSLIVHSSSSGSDAVERALRWVSEAPTALYTRRPSVLPDISGSLLSYSRSAFPARGEAFFKTILRRVRTETDEETTQALSGKLLRFAFDNVRLPLGSVVADAFPDVYAIAVRDTRPPFFLVSLFFGSDDWDKAKDLRVSLVEAFLRSNWAPGDLAIAANNAGILRKIFKRLHRTHGGDRYAASMHKDLVHRNDPQLIALAANLKSLIADPDFYEDWD